MTDKTISSKKQRSNSIPTFQEVLWCMVEQGFERKYGKQQKNTRENRNVIESVIDQEKSHLKIK